jgi:enoyl-CoA hydratase/carnithine racemase
VEEYAVLGQLVEYRVEHGLAIIDLNHPPANTYSYEMMRELDGAILTARMDEAAHVLIVRGKFEMHLIDYVFGRDDFWTQILEYARQFVPPNKASKAVGHIKRAVCTGMEIPLAEGLAVERELQQRLFDGSDAAEGLAAYVNKSVPRFKGA